MEKLNKILTEIQQLIENKDVFFNGVHKRGTLSMEHRKLLREVRATNLYPSNIIETNAKFLMVSNWIEKFQNDIVNCFTSIESKVSDSENNIIVLENTIMDVLSKTNRCILSINEKNDFIQSNEIKKIEIYQNELDFLIYIENILAGEIEIDIVEHISDGVKNAQIDNEIDKLIMLTNFIDRENIFEIIYNSFISKTLFTLNRCYEKFYFRFSKNLKNLSRKDIDKLDLPDLITKVNAKNTDLRTLMNNHKEQYDTLMKYLQNDKDIDGKTKNIQIKKSCSSSSFEWIALEGNKHHIQKIHSIFVFCNYKKWLSCNWLKITSIDRKKIILNTFGIDILRQNLSNKKMNEIEGDIKQIVLHNDDFKYLTFIKNFIINS